MQLKGSAVGIKEGGILQHALHKLEVECLPKDIPEHIEKLAAERWQAKQDKEWARSDELRDEIAKAGWKVTDSKEGYSLTPE